VRIVNEVKSVSQTRMGARPVRHGRGKAIRRERGQDHLASHRRGLPKRTRRSMNVAEDIQMDPYLVQKKAEKALIYIKVQAAFSRGVRDGGAQCARRGE